MKNRSANIKTLRAQDAVRQDDAVETWRRLDSTRGAQLWRSLQPKTDALSLMIEKSNQDLCKDDNGVRS